MHLKILNPYKNHPHQGREYDTVHYDTFQRNEILFNYVINKLYQLKDKEKSEDVIICDTYHPVHQTYLYQAGMNHLLQMKNLWGIDDRKNSILRSIWENVCRCESDNEWKIPYIKSIGKHKYLKKVLSKNSTK